MRSSVEIFETPEALAREVAAHVVEIGVDAMERRGRFDLALAGGSTPKAAYEILHGPEFREALDWSLVRFFFGDERCVPPDDDDSNYKMAKEALLDPLQIRPHAVFRMRGEIDAPEAARAYAQILRDELGIEPVLDLVMLGMGPDGHTASLFPGADPTTDDAALVRAPWVAKFNSFRITVTPHVINAARNVAIATEGTEKAQALAAVLDGPYDPQNHPIQIVSPRSGNLRWLVDRSAASGLATRSS